MRWFRSEPTVPTRPPMLTPKAPATVPPRKPEAPIATAQAVNPPVNPPLVKPPVVEGWSESELVAVYNAAPVRNLKKGETLFSNVLQTESFFVLLDGAIEVVVKLDGHAGRPGIFQRGDVVAPLPKSPGL